ncbi:MAG: CoA transferase [Burkholderiales bacterium]|nr:CoA transferase [Burkholderiales bacterium]
MQAENVAFFEQAEVTIGPIYDISRSSEDPHVLERELIADYPDEDMGEFPMHHGAARPSGTPAHPHAGATSRRAQPGAAGRSGSGRGSVRAVAGGRHRLRGRRCCASGRAVGRLDERR